MSLVAKSSESSLDCSPQALHEAWSTLGNDGLEPTHKPDTESTVDHLQPNIAKAKDAKYAKYAKDAKDAKDRVSAIPSLWTSMQSEFQRRRRHSDEMRLSWLERLEAESGQRKMQEKRMAIELQEERQRERKSRAALALQATEERERGTCHQSQLSAAARLYGICDA